MSADANRRAALDWAQQHRPDLVPGLLRDLALGGTRPQDGPSRASAPTMLLEELAARYWKAAGQFLGSKDSQEFRIRYLCESQPYPDKPPLGKWPVMDITTETFEDFRTLRKGQKTRLIDRETGEHKLTSPASRNAEVRLARRMYNWALAELPRIKDIPYNPLANVRMEDENNIRKTTLGTDEEFERLLGACTNDADLALIMVANDSGPRRMIVMSLRWDQINWETGRITILKADSVTKKTGNPFLMPETLDVLRRLPSKTESAYVFANLRIYSTGRKDRRYGKPMNPRYIYKRYQAVVARSGLQGVNGEPITFHTLRHRFAYVGRVKLKLKQRAMMAVMGHSTTRSHERYGFGDEEEVAEVQAACVEQAQKAHGRRLAKKELAELRDQLRREGLDRDPTPVPVRTGISAAAIVDANTIQNGALGATRKNP
jgi:integrase